MGNQTELYGTWMSELFSWKIVTVLVESVILSYCLLMNLEIEGEGGVWLEILEIILLMISFVLLFLGCWGYLFGYKWILASVLSN